MLVDVTVPLVSMDPMFWALAELTGQTEPTERLRTGVYTGAINMHHLTGHLTYEEEYPEVGDIPEYGVCDSPDQLLALFGEVLEADPRPLFIRLSRIAKEDQPEEGGWRWHKWGPYVGDKEPECEYLYDEGPDITEVWAYHIHVWRDPSEEASA